MRGGKRWIYLISVLIFFAYVAWLIGPYLRSAIVRDASVTTWSRAAVAPIDGRIVTKLPAVGGVIGEDGQVATIRNDLLLQERVAVEETRDRAILAQVRIDEAQDYLSNLDGIERARVAEKDRYVEAFHAQLETEIANLRDEIAVNSEQIDVLQRIVDRRQSLVERGTGSAASLDEELLRLAEMKSRQARLEAALNFALLRDRSADNGVYITEDGGTPDWVRFGEQELRLEQTRTRHELHAARATLEEARKDLDLNQRTMESLAEAAVTALPGAIVVSVVAAPDATVSAGDAIVEWIDCSTLLVDVPVSDAELPLIRLGTAAEVVLEGESGVRKATVLLTRGSAATLDATDLAAIAKGRSPGVAQVLLTLDAGAGDFDRCPVGWAAYVEFPNVGLIDILRARLRL